MFRSQSFSRRSVAVACAMSRDLASIRRWLRRRPLLRGLVGAREIVCGVHERNMRKRLRVVARETPRARIVLFRQQADIVPQTDKALEELSRVVEPAEKDVRVGQPKAARDKCAFDPGQPVIARSRVVAAQKSVDEQTAFDRFNRAADARIRRREKPHRRQQEQARVEFCRAVRLHETSEPAIESLRADILVDGPAYGPPSFDGPGHAEFFDCANSAIEGDPGHDLGIGEGSHGTANLRQAGVGLPPDGGEVVEQGALERPVFITGVEPTAARLMQGVHHFTEYIDLQLTVGAIADANGARALVAG